MNTAQTTVDLAPALGPENSRLGQVVQYNWNGILPGSGSTGYVPSLDPVAKPLASVEGFPAYHRTAAIITAEAAPSVTPGIVSLVCFGEGDTFRVKQVPYGPGVVGCWENLV